MAAWELALVIFAVTYMVVNMVALYVQLKMLNEAKGVVSKSYKVMEKIIDKYEPFIDKMFDDLNDDL